MTQNLEQRLRQHNVGHANWSKRYKPWRLIHQESCSNRKEAREREKYFKSGSGKEFLRKQAGIVPACRQAGSGYYECFPSTRDGFESRYPLHVKNSSSSAVFYVSRSAKESGALYATSWRYTLPFTWCGHLMPNRLHIYRNNDSLSPLQSSQLSSAVEQCFRKAEVPSSNLGAGSSKKTSVSIRRFFIHFWSSPGIHEANLGAGFIPLSPRVRHTPHRYAGLRGIYISHVQP
jgi:putative endonuclease